MPMTFRQLAVASLVTLFLNTGCSLMHGDPKNPQKKSHPVRRYEITATVDAPGPWDSVKGFISYEVVNHECTPENKFIGVHILPLAVNHTIEMTRLNERTWRGFFFRDFVLDDDYYGLGRCHWDVTQASPVFTVHGSNFVPGSGLENTIPYIEYFRKSEYADSTLNYAALGSNEISSKYAKDPDSYFAITVTVKEVTP